MASSGDYALQEKCVENKEKELHIDFDGYEAGDQAIVDEEALREVEQMVDTATNELQEVLDDSPDLKETLEKSLSEIREAVKCSDSRILLCSPSQELTVNESGAGEPTATSPSTTKDSADLKVVLELREAEKQAQQTAVIISELKQSVASLLEKSQMTDLENLELEEKNKLLSQHLQEFESRTRYVQMLVSQIDKRADLLVVNNALEKEKQQHKDEENVFVIKPPPILSPDKAFNSFLPPQQVMPQFARKLSESYNMQEKLAAENADLEGKRYQLQEEIINKDQTVESLHRKLNSLQTELRIVVKENTILTEKLSKASVASATNKNKLKRKQSEENAAMACGGKGICPGDVETRLQNYSNTTHVLEKQLGEMENQVRSMQNELENVQRERLMLEQQRKTVRCSAPCAPDGHGGHGGSLGPPPAGKSACPSTCNPHQRSSMSAGAASGNADQQLRELREQYARLQEDYKNKLTEVAGMRADADKLKAAVKDAQFEKEQAELALRDKEKELKMFNMDKNKLAGSKELLAEQEQQLNIAKQRYREAQDELDELRSLVGDQTSQLEDYRNKYLAAQQCVEEQRRQIDVMEMENQRISEQVNLEIQRVKNQFQEKLQELTPLPDILKATQLKLQEAQQMQMCAERAAEKMEIELQRERDKQAAILAQLENARNSEQQDADGKAALQKQIETWEKKYEDLRAEGERAKMEMARLEETASQNEKRLDEKLHEVCQLTSQLEQLREESARQVARAKDRCENVRRSLQGQISDLERQLAQSRAACRSAQKDRDDIRQKMQCQINNLNESFEQAQMRIRSLQGHVNFLKTSYSNIFGGADADTPALGGDGMDTSCNCPGNY